MSKKEYTPLMLSENLQAHKLTITKARTLFPDVDTLKEKVKSMGFEFNQSRWQDLIMNGTATLRKEYETNTEASLTAIGLNNPHAKQALFPQPVMFDEINLLLSDIRGKCATTELQFNRGVLPVDLEWISIADGCPVIASETEEAIKENFRTYINTQGEHEFFDKLDTLKTAYNSFVAALHGMGFPSFMHSLPELKNFLEEQEDLTVKVQPNAVAWAMELAAIYRK